MNKLFIGREKEQQQLKEYINSDQSEFIAVYGRRRVGKTFLIQKVIGDEYAFYVAGMNKASMRIQLKNFMQGIKKYRPEVPLAKTWLDAFMALENYLESLPEGKKIVAIVLLAVLSSCNPHPTSPQPSPGERGGKVRRNLFHPGGKSVHFFSYFCAIKIQGNNAKYRANY